MSWITIQTVMSAIKEYWFLITLFVSAVITIAYMIVFRVNPWDAQRSAKLRREQVHFHNSVGSTLLDEGRFKAARLEFEEALKLATENQTALNGRYLSELFLGFDSPDWDPAIGLAIQNHLTAVGVTEQERVAHVVQKYLGDLHSRIGNLELKEGFYQKALTLKPDYADALYAWGWSRYFDRSDPNGMEQAFRKMAALNAYDYRGLHGLGYACT
jgi:tetratricopeptide (TPR) repeat protein